MTSRNFERNHTGTVNQRLNILGHMHLADLGGEARLLWKDIARV